MNNQSLPDDLGPRSGLLNDNQIRAAINAGFLFAEDSCDFTKIKYATYELRVSKNYEIVIYTDGELATIKREVDDSGKIIIEPGQTIKVIAKEYFVVPSDIYAKINTVGQIFSAGLAAENTYADPGFSGELYITLSNISSRNLSIKPDDPLARVEFHKLESPVVVSHQGQSGMRKNFVSVESEGNIRELLNEKTVEELMKEMVAKSVDEALQQRHIRSEVLIEKAHNEIEQLKTLRWLFTAMIFLASLAFFIWLDFSKYFPNNQILTIISTVTATLISTAILSFIKNMVVRNV